MALGPYPYRGYGTGNSGYGTGYDGYGPGFGPLGFRRPGALGMLGGLGFVFGGLGAFAGVAGAAYALRSAGSIFGLGARPPFFY